MVSFKGQSATLSLVVATLFFSFPAYSDDLGAFGDRIFQFQMKLALRGNNLAEYKLGTLYEFGISVPPNLDEARKWYQKAADDDYTPAVNRLTYLEIKKSGYDKTKHGNWLDSLVKDAQSSEPNAMILLGQMYRSGIIVKKKPQKALYFLERASSLGHTEVDSEIDAIRREIEAQERAREKAIAESEQQAAEEKAAKQKAAKPKTQKRTKTAKNNSASKKQQAQANKQQLEAEKRRKYEEAMRQLRKEAKLMQEQQSWAEGN